MPRSLKQQNLIIIGANIMWMVLTHLPKLDPHSPKILSVPLSEVAVILLGLTLIALLYILLDVVFGSHQNIGLGTQLVFLLLAGLLMAGLGTHATSVIIRAQLSKNDAVYSLVADCLHGTWGHNMFQIGYYGLLLLLVWTEASRACTSTDKGPSKVANGVSKCVPTQYSAPVRTSKSTVAMLKFEDVISWTWSLAMGMFYSMLAVLTFTVPVTALFEGIVLFWVVVHCG